MDTTRLDTIKKWFEILQVIVTTIAIMLGGWWTIYTFNSLNQVDKAKAQLVELKRNLIQEAVLDINLTAQVNTIRASSSERYISGKATITNTGTRRASMNFDHLPPFSLTKVNFDSKGLPSFEKTTNFNMKLPGKEVPNIVLSSNETIDIPFLIRVNDPGIYYIDYSVPQEAEEEMIHKKLVTDNSIDNSIWVSGIYLIVE